MSAKMMSLAVAVAAVAMAGSANAALVAYEGFGANSTGFNQPFPVSGSTTSLTYGGLATEGGSRAGGGTSAYNLLSSPVTSGTVWMSWLYKTAPTPAQWNRLITFTGNDPYDHVNEVPPYRNERYNLGYFDSWFGIRGTNGAGAHPTATLTAPQVGDTTYMFVAKYEFNAAGTADGRITLWVSPNTDSLGTGLEPIGGQTIVANLISDDSMGFTGITFEASGSQFDEFRLGQSWIDVSPLVPEPATAGILAGAALLGMARRRR